jgi:hypothetical protein
MASFTKVNGTTQPVFAMDVANGSISGTANIAAQGSVNLAGPGLDFFSLVANASIATGGNVNGYINNTIQAIQSGAGITGGSAGGTVALYQVSPAGSQLIFNFALYPKGAYANTAQVLAAAVTANASGGLTTVGWASCASNAVFTTMAATNTGLPLA